MTGWITLFLLTSCCLLFDSCSAATVITAYNDEDTMEIEPDDADEIDWSKHPCRRPCVLGSTMTCHYIFKVESYYTMSKACFDCPSNITDCFRPHCVPADGVKKSITVVNRQMPGPAIEVCQGDRIVVDVMNLLYSESTTLHWHGQHQRDTPYMDGVPQVTQCPIPPGSSFRYDFVATEAGSHFWHSHLGVQRCDGLFGPLIVRVPPERDWHRRIYDLDMFTLLVFDWTHTQALDKFLWHHHAGGSNKPPNILVNGFGRMHAHNGNKSTPMPISTFTVKRNLSYRFRLINAEFLNCPIELSIDNHTLHVISSDGNDIEPIQAESLVSYAGERFDFVVKTNQEIDNYWIRFRGLIDCDERFTKAHQVAILRYEGAPLEDPSGTPEYERVPNEELGVQVNALNEGTESNRTVSIPLLRAMDKDSPANTRDPDYQFYVSYDFYDKDNPHFHRKDLYGFHQVKDNASRIRTPQLNHISMKLPPFPVLPQRDMIQRDQFCNESTVSGCEKDYCACTHVLRVKLKSVVEVILVDEGFAYDANHPFHLHGAQFRVIAMERVGSNVTVDQVKELDAKGLIQRNLHRAPLKDTVTVPDGGYTVLRFYADNPGYWLFHCHIEFHAEVGMSLLFKVGDHEAMPPVPQHFPRCGNWYATDSPAKAEVQEGQMEIDDNKVTEILRLIPQVLRIFDGTSSAVVSLPSILSLFLCTITSLAFLLPEIS